MIDIPSHSGLEERIDVARRLREEMGMDSSVEVLVDNMEDSFNKEFAASPRYFIAKEGFCYTRPRTASRTTCLTKTLFRTSSGAWVLCGNIFPEKNTSIKPRKKAQNSNQSNQ